MPMLTTPRSLTRCFFIMLCGATLEESCFFPARMRDTSKQMQRPLNRGHTVKSSWKASLSSSIALSVRCRVRGERATARTEYNDQSSVSTLESREKEILQFSGGSARDFL